jgi:hypothetical protein
MLDNAGDNAGNRWHSAGAAAKMFSHAQDGTYIEVASHDASLQ